MIIKQDQEIKIINVDTYQIVDYFTNTCGFYDHEKTGKIYQGLYVYSNFGIMVYEIIINNCWNNLTYYLFVNIITQ